MRIRYSAELDQDALLAYDEVERTAEGVLASMIAKSDLRDLAIEIRYVPVVMNEEGRKRYLARSRLRPKEMAYSCCPQLPLEPFVSGTRAEQYEVFLGGLRKCGPALKELGATDEQVGAFDRMLNEALAELVGAK